MEPILSPNASSYYFDADNAVATTAAASVRQHALYHYVPSDAAAIMFAILFSITSGIHLFQVVKSRMWFFLPLAIGGIFEVMGYIGRAISHNNVWALGPYIVQSTFLLIAPTCFAAAIYSLLSVIIRSTGGEAVSIVPPKWITILFLSGDVISFFLQGGAGGIMVKGGAEGVKIGKTMIRTGLLIQVVFFLFFMAVAITFHYRIRARPSPQAIALKSTSDREGGGESAATTIRQAFTFRRQQVDWETMLYAAYCMSCLILIRSLYRVAEYFQEGDGAILQNETYLYVFDAALMWLVMVGFNSIHPSKMRRLHPEIPTGIAVLK